MRAGEDDKLICNKLIVSQLQLHYQTMYLYRKPML